jgi:hypothetical protein
MVRVGVSVIGLGFALLVAMPAVATERSAFIDVAGAPGDGEQALERALSNRLLDEGFAIKSMPAADAYEIQGTVRLAPAVRGKENVRIDWTIFGPEGTRLGNVTQVKEIRQGSLDGRWGAAAIAAADAAAQDILKLLDGRQKAAGARQGAP